VGSFSGWNLPLPPRESRKDGSFSLPWFNPGGCISVATYGGVSVTIIRQSNLLTLSGAPIPDHTVSFFPILFINGVEQSDISFASADLTSDMVEEIRAVAIVTALKDTGVTLGIRTREIRLCTGTNPSSLVRRRQSCCTRWGSRGGGIASSRPTKQQSWFSF
jgi:hypothetical protein